MCHRVIHALYSVCLRLADMGHVIVGVEISEEAIKQFFKEHSLEYKEKPVSAIPEAKLFKVYYNPFTCFSFISFIQPTVRTCEKSVKQLIWKGDF